MQRHPNWEDIRIALAVARRKTVSGAAVELGLHHTTIIRRIDALEERLGARLFHRNPRGYVATEAGAVLMQAASEADACFAQMGARISGSIDRIAGEIAVTSLPDLADLIMPRLLPLMEKHPDLRIRYLTDARLLRLDEGEAHVAIRGGTHPTQPDYVVIPIDRLQSRLIAAPAYLKRHGPVEDLARHRFVLPGPEAQNAPHMRWLEGRIGPENIVLTSNDPDAVRRAILQGLGLGWTRRPVEGTTEVLALPEWVSQFWLVTHVDLHRTSRVQAVVKALRKSISDAEES